MYLQRPINSVDAEQDLGPEHLRLENASFELLSDRQWSYLQRLYHMSPRELQVAKLVCQGMAAGDVAKYLAVQPGTIKTHLRSIFGKTQSSSKIRMLLKFLDDASRIHQS